MSNGKILNKLIPSKYNLWDTLYVSSMINLSGVLVCSFVYQVNAAVTVHTLHSFYLTE